MYSRESAHLGCEERVMREDGERFSICAAEVELHRTLGHVDLHDLHATQRCSGSRSGATGASASTDGRKRGVTFALDACSYPYP